AASCDPRKDRFDGRDRLALIEVMHASVGIEHGDAGTREMRRGCRLAHADPSREAYDEHHLAPRDAATCAFNSGVTSGHTPNQRWTPGRACCGRVQSPPPGMFPRGRGAARSPVWGGL